MGDVRPPSWTSRNSKRHWSSENYRYYVGQTVLWPEGHKGGIPYGIRGEVIELPTKDRRTLLIALDDRPGVHEFEGGSSIVPLRMVYRQAARALRERAAAYAAMEKKYDQFGRFIVERRRQTLMPWKKPKWCTARHGDVTCELRYEHEGDHRAEAGAAIWDKASESWLANVVSWAD